MTAAGELFHVEGIAYQGSKLAGYTDKTGTTTGSTAYSFGYYSGGQLGSVAATPSGTATGLTQSFTEQYSFRGDNVVADGPTVGNLEYVSRTDGAGSTTTDYAFSTAYRDQVAQTTVTTSVASNALTYTHDPLGRITAKGANAERFTYDHADHLLSATRAAGASESLWYGPMGELVMRQQGQQMTWYAGAFATVTAQLPAGCQVAGCAADQTTLQVDAHVLLGTTRIASVRSKKSGTTFPILQTLYYYRDRQGSVVATSTAGGVLGVQLRYGPYGTLDKVVGANAGDTDCRTTATCPELGYTGALRLSGSLVFLNARVYDTALRRFLSADSVDLARYTYTGGDPANYTDPTGLLRAEGANPQAAPVPLISFDGWRVTEFMAEMVLEKEGYCSGHAQCHLMIADMMFTARVANQIAAIGRTYARAAYINGLPPVEVRPVSPPVFPADPEESYTPITWEPQPAPVGSYLDYGPDNTPTYRYNFGPPRTVPVSGETQRALQCLGQCVRDTAGNEAHDLLVTGGAEQTGHGLSAAEGGTSHHYRGEAVDIAGPQFNPVTDGQIFHCAMSCGFGAGQFERFGNPARNHWHFQLYPGNGVPPIPSVP
jgi:RHS repeat-associated protein